VVAACVKAHVCSNKPAVFNIISANTAAALAKAAACHNAVVSATWQSEVKLLKTIVVGNASSLTVTGANVDTAFVDGSGKRQLFDVRERGSLTLVNITLTNGFTKESNGGAVILGPFSSLTATGCVFSSNVVRDRLGSADSSAANTEDDLLVGTGGAIYADINSTVTIIGSRFESNTASMAGGGIWSEGDAVNITNSLFICNTACIDDARSSDCYDGGGAISFAGDVSISDSNFTNNICADAGGALYSIRSSRIAITRSVFEGNAASSGGAASLEGFVQLNDSNFFNNTSSEGGAVDCGGILAIKHSTFTNNSIVIDLDGSLGVVGGGALALRDDPDDV
jgi:hypothetical protein